MNIAAATGDMGILANHVPSIEPLRAGVVEVIESTGSKKWFGELQRRVSFSSVIHSSLAVSGGFATVHPNNKLTINVVEAAPLDHFSAEVTT